MMMNPKVIFAQVDLLKPAVFQGSPGQTEDGEEQVGKFAKDLCREL